MSFISSLVDALSRTLKESCPRNSMILFALFLTLLELRKVFNGSIANYFYQQIPFVLITNVAAGMAIILVLWMFVSWALSDALRKSIFYSIYSLVLVGVLAAYQFLHKTGTLVDYKLTSYFVKNLADLTPVLLSGTDINFWVQIVGVGSAIFFLIYFDEKKYAVSNIFFGVYFGALITLFLVGCVYSQTGNDVEQKPVINSSYRGPVLSYFFGSNQIGLRTMVKPSDVVDVYQEPSIIKRETAPPNIIFVVLESTRFDAFLGMQSQIDNGDEASVLRKIFHEGRQFHNLYTSVSHTSKAMVGIHCGVFPHPVMNIVESFPEGKFFKCLPETLAGAGYNTAHFQTALGRFENRPGLANNLGFQKVVVGEDLRSGKFESIGYFGLDDMAMVQPAIDWITQQKQSYFIQLLTVGTHHPYQTPGGTFTETKEAYEDAARYSVKFLDTFFEALSQASSLDNTMVVIMSDHGEAFGEHGRYQHDMVPYEEVVHTPAVIWWPGHLQAGIDHQLRSHLDIYPTVLDVVADEWSGRLTGLSLLANEGHKNIYSLCWYTYTCMSIRHQNGLKAIYNFRNGAFEVYNLKTDPDELHNLRADYSNAELIDLFGEGLALKASMDNFYMEKTKQ